ncbi:MAG: hypothetical protein U0531_20385 [Dehalococcoidia bacterium]
MLTVICGYHDLRQQEVIGTDDVAETRQIGSRHVRCRHFGERQRHEAIERVAQHGPPRRPMPVFTGGADGEEPARCVLEDVGDHGGGGVDEPRKVRVSLRHPDFPRFPGLAQRARHDDRVGGEPLCGKMY